MSFEEIIGKINGVVWSDALIGLALIAGIYFSIRTRFVQFRLFGDMVKLLFKGKQSEKGVSSFQALALAISGRVGTGNIAGVAAAIYWGGPGALFWMWFIAVLGAASAFVESTLGQIYKRVEEGEYRGGPAYYIERGLGMKWYSALFAVVTIVSTAFLLPGIQSNSIAQGMTQAFGVNNWYTGGFIALALAVIVIGGVKRISKAAEIIVPIMAVGYIILSVVIIGMNISHVPDVFSLIISSAFGNDAIFGGLLGSAIAWGVKRGIYSNEAGQGTSPHAAAAAEVSHPVKQGLVQAFSVYIDTLFVCTATGFMLLFTGMFNVVDVVSGEMVVENLPGVEVGTAYTQAAVNSQIVGFGEPFIAISLLFFAFTTILAYYYYAETNVSYLFSHKYRGIMIWVLRGIILVATFLGAIWSAEMAWNMGDIGVGLMAWLNLIAILFLSKPALRALKDYERQKKEGKDPVFNADEVGIKNTDEWK